MFIVIVVYNSILLLLHNNAASKANSHSNDLADCEPFVSTMTHSIMTIEYHTASHTIWDRRLTDE